MSYDVIFSKVFWGVPFRIAAIKSGTPGPQAGLFEQRLSASAAERELKTGANWQIARTSKAHDLSPAFHEQTKSARLSLPRQGMFPSGSLRLRFAVLESLRSDGTEVFAFRSGCFPGSFWLTILQRLQGEMIFQTDGRPVSSRPPP